MAANLERSTPADPWETGELGEDAEFAQASDESAEKELDDALQLQMISIRLQKQLINALKFIAKHHGIGYQPLIRDVLARFVVNEQKKILWDTFEQMRLQQESIEELQKEPCIEHKSQPENEGPAQDSPKRRVA
jgi:predicted DNA binding CopG/RHH family protein